MRSRRPSVLVVMALAVSAAPAGADGTDDIQRERTRPPAAAGLALPAAESCGSTGEEGAVVAAGSYVTTDPQNDVRIYVRERKPESYVGNPYVFVHGFMLDGRLWECQAEYLYRRNRYAITYDLRGHGNSSKPADGSLYTLDAHVRDLRRVITELLGDTPPRINLVYTDIGGPIAMQYGSRYSSDRADETNFHVYYNYAIAMTPKLVNGGGWYFGVDSNVLSSWRSLFTAQPEAGMRSWLDFIFTDTCGVDQPGVIRQRNTWLENLTSAYRGNPSEVRRGLLNTYDEWLQWDVRTLLPSVGSWAWFTYVLHGSNDVIVNEMNARAQDEQIDWSARVELASKGHAPSLTDADTINRGLVLAWENLLDPAFHQCSVCVH